MNFDKLTKPYETELMNSLKQFISIPSVNDPSTYSLDAPLGKGIKDALTAFAKLGKENGFDVELDSRYCELSIGKEGPLIEIFGHLDVVPVNKLKDRDMFTLVEKDDVLLGRGVIDDKGPLLASFYAVKALKDNNLLNDVRIKFFAGGDEEKGCTCLKKYFKEKHKEAPTYGFTPDSGFPIVYGEKGIGNIVIKRKIKLPHITSIKGGLAVNVVIPKCEFKVDNINEIKDKIKVPHEVKGDIITFIGKSAHGAFPELGINAFILGLRELGYIYNDSEMIRIADCFKDTAGRGLNAYTKCPNLKESTYNLGLIEYKKDELIFTINFRHPESPKPEVLTKNICDTLKCELVKAEYTPYLFLGLDTPLVKCLLNAYQEETNDYKTEGIVTGGGTYAKEAKNTLAFGPGFPGYDFKEHQDEEYITKTLLFKTMSIYAHAIYNLINYKK